MNLPRNSVFSVGSCAKGTSDLSLDTRPSLLLPIVAVVKSFS
jgi:hypothetical protein